MTVGDRYSCRLCLCVAANGDAALPESDVEVVKPVVVEEQGLSLAACADTAGARPGEMIKGQVARPGRIAIYRIEIEAAYVHTPAEASEPDMTYPLKCQRADSDG